MLIVKGIATLFGRWEVSFRLKTCVCVFLYCAFVCVCMGKKNCMMRQVFVASTVKEGDLTKNISECESTCHVLRVCVCACALGYGVLK